MASPAPAPGLVVTRTPLRVSFAGGGTDFPDFYQLHQGAVLSTTIDKYLYVTVKHHGDLFNEKYRLNYSETEQVGELDDISNDIARECLRLLPVQSPVYISTVADLPAFSGLGSSSTFAVGLLNALHALRGDRVSAGQLAEEAAYVEMDVLKRPIGKQDHYAAAFGGMNYLSFFMDGRVSIEPQRLSGDVLAEMFDHLMLYWTGLKRDAATILTQQRANIADRSQQLLGIRDQAKKLRDAIGNSFHPEFLGQILDAGWLLKRQLADGITNGKIDVWYEKAKEAGAIGGKLCGAGGGGFLLFVVPPKRKTSVQDALSHVPEIPIGYESQGSRVMIAE